MNAKPGATVLMEFKSEQLVERELEIAAYLLQEFSIKKISDKTGLSRKHLDAHIRNMMEKLGEHNLFALKQKLQIIIQ